ncbi:endo-1,4-beta-xylanase [Pararhodonellum marinum]|uniref:endo-1,4-beta-xylanase n=1 Tax=Pararhodonellum marinum TaxID=2755358 RepID=UPI00188E832A|nr:endo-1,4-beta-xylanase [Pararhodonellum marinum]
MKIHRFALLLPFLLALGFITKDKAEEPGMKDAYKDVFYIGAALNHRQINGQDEKALPVLQKHFNSITGENLMKWGPIHPQPDKYNFGLADQFVDLGEQLDAFIIGHTLVWHNQTPNWVFEDENGQPLTKEPLLARMEDHIEQVAGRYKGRIHGWDVVNEAFFDDGKFRNSKWFEAAGKDFIKRAFIKANEVDPEMELYYNDYNMWKPEKRDAAIALAKEMKEEGIRIDGIGMQGHYGLESPSLEQIEASIVAIAEAGFSVMFTEVDIDVLPNPVNRFGADIDATFETEEKYNVYKEGLPLEVQIQLAERYEELFALFYKHRDKISRVTFWGIHDGGSWLNNWPMRGRTAYPLPFDRLYDEKKMIIERIKKVPGK